MKDLAQGVGPPFALPRLVRGGCRLCCKGVQSSQIQRIGEDFVLVSQAELEPFGVRLLFGIYASRNGFTSLSGIVPTRIGLAGNALLVRTGIDPTPSEAGKRDLDDGDACTRRAMQRLPRSRLICTAKCDDKHAAQYEGEGAPRVQHGSAASHCI